MNPIVLLVAIPIIYIFQRWLDRKLTEKWGPKG